MVRNLAAVGDVILSSDLAKHTTWRKFLKKGYFVVPADPEPAREAVANRWYYEGRKKDTPEPYPLPSDYSANYLDGMQTVSGKYEFIAQTLKKIEREAWPVQCSKVVFGCERQSLAKRRRAPPEDMRRLRMSIGNHVQQEVRAANHERQYRLRQGSPSNDITGKGRTNDERVEACRN